MKQIKYKNRTLLQKILFWVAMIGQIAFPVLIFIIPMQIMKNRNVEWNENITGLCIFFAIVSMFITVGYLIKTDKNVEDFHTGDLYD